MVRIMIRNVLHVLMVPVTMIRAARTDGRNRLNDISRRVMARRGWMTLMVVPVGGLLLHGSVMMLLMVIVLRGGRTRVYIMWPIRIRRSIR